MDCKTVEILAITDDVDFVFERGLNLELDIDVNNDKIIIFSDLHRGNGGGNDDHRNCYATYLKALKYYLDNNYRLILLGDVEELWENFDFREIYEEYLGSYELEKHFFNKGTLENPFYIRCYGNHDYRFSIPEFVESDLAGIAGLKEIQVYEGVKLNVCDNGTEMVQIFCTHGHQGHYPRRRETAQSFSTALFGIFQSITKIPTNESITHEPLLLRPMRRDTNAGYLKWGHRKRKIVVYGHTHEAVFMSRRVLNGETIEMYENDDQLITTPNAFNTGSCSFINGEISGMEILNGNIRLIRWTVDDSQTEPEIVRFETGELAEMELKNISEML